MIQRNMMNRRLRNLSRAGGSQNENQHGRLGYVEVLSDDLKVVERISDWPIQNLKADLFTVLNRGVTMVINPRILWWDLQYQGLLESGCYIH